MRTISVAILGLSIASVVGAQRVTSDPAFVASPLVEQYRAALRFGADGDLDRARGELDAVLRADPFHSSAKLRLRTLNDVASGVIVSMTAVHLFRAAEKSDTGRHMAALAEIDSGIALSPSYDEAVRLRGRTRVELGEFPAAIQDYNQALSLNPRNTQAILNRGAVFVRIGDFDRALNDYNRAIESDPLNPECYVNRGVIYSNRRLFAKALADFDKAIELDPAAPSAYNNVALLYENLHRWDEALKTYKALIQHARRGYPELVEHAKSRIRELERP